MTGFLSDFFTNMNNAYNQAYGTAKRAQYTQAMADQARAEMAQKAADRDNRLRSLLAILGRPSGSGTPQQQLSAYLAGATPGEAAQYRRLLAGRAGMPETNQWSIGYTTHWRSYDPVTGRMIQGSAPNTHLELSDQYMRSLADSLRAKEQLSQQSQADIIAAAQGDQDAQRRLRLREGQAGAGVYHMTPIGQGEVRSDVYDPGTGKTTSEVYKSPVTSDRGKTFAAINLRGLNNDLKPMRADYLSTAASVPLANQIFGTPQSKFGPKELLMRPINILLKYIDVKGYDKNMGLQDLYKEAINQLNVVKSEGRLNAAQKSALQLFGKGLPAVTDYPKVARSMARIMLQPHLNLVSSINQRIARFNAINPTLKQSDRYIVPDLLQQPIYDNNAQPFTFAGKKTPAEYLNAAVDMKDREKRAKQVRMLLEKEYKMYVPKSYFYYWTGK